MRRALGCLALTGCILATSSSEDVVRAVREFNSDLRWGRSEHVLPRLAPAARARYTAQLQALGDDIEFVDEEVVGIDVKRGPRGRDQAICRVEISWSSRRTGIVEKTSVIEHWEAAGPNWVVNRMVRTRGTPLALFEEPPAPKAGAKDPAAPAPDAPAPSEQPKRDP
jgi:hypothetical protein